MSNKGNVFNSSSVTTKSALDNVRETLRVSAEGTVSFKSRLGRGSGSPVEIPGANFDEFVSLMQDLAKRREEVAQTEQTAATASSSSGSSDSETDSE